ncbi:hypothetical protein CLOHYLEM_06297 [[Clostridium] hylemonae DSM 15053]|uniref:Uncharacterized protein n=1 Tax=[Clostridium] hylemonae DSM 15053 TaxID=553973 RepID=C0C2J1_9FIRM|nr:hypothetical protein CLOHYLEM_06297 [[Clostridium] hylemonae DSM 15053]
MPVGRESLLRVERRRLFSVLGTGKRYENKNIVILYSNKFIEVRGQDC